MGTRAIVAELPAGMDGSLGGNGGGSPPLCKEDRSQLLHAPERELVRLGTGLRAAGGEHPRG